MFRFKDDAVEVLGGETEGDTGEGPSEIQAVGEKCEDHEADVGEKRHPDEGDESRDNGRSHESAPVVVVDMCIGPATIDGNEPRGECHDE